VKTASARFWVSVNSPFITENVSQPSPPLAPHRDIRPDRGRAAYSDAVTAATACRTCGTEPLENARFCHSCGAPITGDAPPAEYKQVTVLFAEVIRLSERIIELADDDATKGNLIIGSPLATWLTLRGVAQCSFGESGWRDDIERGMEIARATDPFTWATLSVFKYGCLLSGALPADAAALQETSEILAIAERSGDDFTLAGARYSRGLALVHHDGPEREEDFALLGMARDAAVHERFTMAAIPIIDTWIAAERLRTGDIDGAIELSPPIVETVLAWEQSGFAGPAATVLVESLRALGTDEDLQEAQTVIERLGALPAEEGSVFPEIHVPRLPALLARARGDEAGYRKFADGYLRMANSLGFEGHIAAANAM